jgi:uncharacterized SAM-binding protein YcdF (DUF218 family)
MFSQKKYIFETKQTRMIRYLKNAFLTLVSLTLGYLCSSLLFVLVSEYESKQALEAFFKRPPALIVVFTGDAGRIPFAIKKAKEFEQSQILITGVHSQNSVETILKPITEEGKSALDSDLLEIDYLARNTVENVLSTLRYLRERKDLDRVLIISHDYHIMRIKLIMNKVKTKSDNFEFYYSGIKTDYTSLRNIRILLTEVFKFMRTYVFLLVWDHDINNEYLAH